MTLHLSLKQDHLIPVSPINSSRSFQLAREVVIYSYSICKFYILQRQINVLTNFSHNKLITKNQNQLMVLRNSK